MDFVVGNGRFRRVGDDQSGLFNSNYPGATAHGC